MKARTSGTPGPVIDISALIEAHGLDSYAVRVIVVCWLVTFFDGYDMNVFGLAAPFLGPAYHLDKVMLGAVASASTFGLLFGAAIFGRSEIQDSKFNIQKFNAINNIAFDRFFES